MVTGQPRGKQSPARIPLPTFLSISLVLLLAKCPTGSPKGSAFRQAPHLSSNPLLQPEPQQLQAHSLKNIPWIKSLKDTRTLIAKEISRGATLAHQWLTCESALYSVSRIQTSHYPSTSPGHTQDPMCIMPHIQPRPRSWLHNTQYFHWAGFRRNLPKGTGTPDSLQGSYTAEKLHWIWEQKQWVLPSRDERYRIGPVISQSHRCPVFACYWDIDLGCLAGKGRDKVSGEKLQWLLLIS